MKAIKKVRPVPPSAFELPGVITVLQLCVIEETC